MRKLASIQTIKALEPIAGADMIEKTTVLGWQLVVKKDEFKVGDKCVYCEIDSILPEKPEFEFLRPKNYRIRTVKLKGQVSQGIAFPLTVLNSNINLEEGLDVTDMLGVTKYESDNDNITTKESSFPSFIIKTDEVRIQSSPEILTKYSGTLCYWTEKLDGTSFTGYLKDGEFGICSRNRKLNPLFKDNSDGKYWNISNTLALESKLRKLGRNLAVQGELIGTNIQGNKYKVEALELYVFSIFDINLYSYLPYDEFIDVTSKLELKTVPILSTKYILGSDDVNSLVKMSEAKSILNS